MLQSGKVAVTTSRKVHDDRLAYARDRALQWELPFVERADQSMPQLLAAYDAVIVFEDDGVRLADVGADLAFHPGMAQQRIDRLQRGEPDALVEIAELEPGLRVVDATLGLGRDALVAAFVLGPSGRVVGLEANAVLYAFASEGLRGYVERHHLAPRIAPISVRHADALAWLRTTTERFDVVVLDPMFARPKAADPGFELLRRHAVGDPVTDELIAAARHRADRVVVKVGGPKALDDLAHRPERIRTTRAVTWARFPGLG